MKLDAAVVRVARALVEAQFKCARLLNVIQRERKLSVNVAI
jgi:hypothetical protein